MAIVTSILRGGTNNHETTSEEANAIATDFIAEGIVDAVGNTSGVAPMTGGLAINAQGTPDMTVEVGSGICYVEGTPTSQNSQMFRVKISAAEDVTISANSSGSTKYDWLYVKLDATNLNDPNSAADNVATLVTSRSSSASTDDGTPPTYGYPIAVITVANGATSITNSMIRDIRTQASVNAGASSSADTWTALGYTPGTVTYNGNRSYNLTIANTDVTNVLSNGMRVKLARTVTPPTQCTDLEASSSQYWSKASPAGTTFTDDFCAGAWIKLKSYTGAQQTIVSRYNGTSGWRLDLAADGTVKLVGFNGGSANFSQVQSYQSIPLGKWVHVAAQLDMSAFTATSTTSYVMIDGVNVPAAVSRGGTNPTSLINNVGNLEVGAANSGAIPFDGKIAQCWYSSAKITQATIQTFISQSMTGSETSIVSLFKFNGDGNDSNANANNLSANGGATATTADSPFNSTEYGIITANSFSTDTTLTVQVPEGYAIPTSGGVSSMYYSTQDVPYGFPRDKGKWRVSMFNKRLVASTSNATFGAFNSGGHTLTVPIGAWKVGWYGSLQNSSTTTVIFSLSSTALTGLSIASAADITPYSLGVKASSAANYINMSYVEHPQNLTSATTYTIYSFGATTSGAVDGASSKVEIFAEFEYI